MPPIKVLTMARMTEGPGFQRPASADLQARAGGESCPGAFQSALIINTPKPVIININPIYKLFYIHMGVFILSGWGVFMIRRKGLRNSTLD